MLLSGKTAVITGAARGIGKAITLRYAKEGANLLLLDMQESLLRQTAARAEQYGVRVSAQAADVTDAERVRACVDEAAASFGSLDILVNNAGIYVKKPQHLIDPQAGPQFLNIRPEYCRQVLEVNVMGTYHMISAVLPYMLRQTSGKIINLGSVAGVNGIPGMAEYSASKGAIIAFTKALAHEVASSRICVNCISPGSILVEGGSTPMTYLGRYGCPDDIAGAALFLAGADSDFMIGQNLIVDGGRTLSLHCES